MFEFSLRSYAFLPSTRYASKHLTFNTYCPDIAEAFAAVRGAVKCLTKPSHLDLREKMLEMMDGNGPDGAFAECLYVKTRGVRGCMRAYGGVPVET